MKKILLVEDDASLCRGISFKLKKEGYEVLTSPTVKDAIVIFENNKIDLVISDITLEDGDGYELCQKIRQNSDVLFIFLTALDQEVDMVTGYDLGADDYITKPFNPEELIARVNAIIRRCSKSNVLSEKAGLIKAGNLTIDDELKKVVVDGKEVKLTPTEYNILKFLTQNKGKVYSIDEIYTNIWEEESFAAENIIAVHIRHIREKIEVNPKEPKYLKVIWGVGYKVENL